MVLLLVMGFAMTVKAQDYLYLGGGYSNSSRALAIRSSIILDNVGVELNVKSDLNRPFKSAQAMDGQRHRFSFMGGLTYDFLDFLHLTACAGYGSAGIYRVTGTAEGYGVEGLTRGLEAGGFIDVFLGDISVFGGWSRIFAQRNGPFSEFTIGVGLRL